MKTIFSTGPGFYAASTHEFDDLVTPGNLRLFIARIEAYELPAKTGTEFDKHEFMLLPAMASNKPEVARALLQLHASLSQNLRQLKIEAKT